MDNLQQITYARCQDCIALDNDGVEWECACCKAYTKGYNNGHYRWVQDWRDMSFKSFVIALALFTLLYLVFHA